MFEVLGLGYDAVYFGWYIYRTLCYTPRTKPPDILLQEASFSLPDLKNPNVLSSINLQSANREYVLGLTGHVARKGEKW